MAREYRLGATRRFINRITTSRVNAGKPVGADVRLLTTIGRRTGLERTNPVTIMTLDGREWLVAPYGSVPWVHNIRNTPRATLSKAGEVMPFVATEVPPDEAAPILKLYVNEVRVVRPFFDVSHDDPVDAFRDVGDKPVFRIETAG